LKGLQGGLNSNRGGDRFRVESRELANAVVYDLYGDLSREAEETLLTFRDWESEPEAGAICRVFNFTGVPYINSIGIAVLIRIVRSIAKVRGQTFAFGVTAHYQKLFRMVGLTDYMMIYPNEYAVVQRIAHLTGEDEGQ
jgi:stage II sporulation protein AA (anti-sigma F factor antagonist)